ncbi:TlpA disulfide reductase family protein [Mucilaginibacter defluvii]|uniref:Thioredoxin domain-containing protein n=1 Tax=Mucilaginibacter defluvii TaxID=1196019 RepID=A0ABP9G7C3_9SPHI
MKKLIYAALILVTAIGCIQAKNDKNDNGTESSNTAQAPIRNTEKLAPFKILTTDSTYFSYKDLKPGKPVMLIYFAPDCGHCHDLMKELKPQFKQLAKVQVVLVTWTKYESLKPFYKEFELAKQPNFKVGTEGYDMPVQKYYQIAQTPFTILYDKNGKLVKAFPKAPKADELLAEVKKV